MANLQSSNQFNNIKTGVKIFLVMGLPWITEVLSFIAEWIESSLNGGTSPSESDSVSKKVFIALDIFNLLQGNK